MADRALPNFYASIAATVNFISRHPRVFAETLGKMLWWCGEDKIIYGGESPIWHPQWALEAFWNFELPADIVEDYGYPPLTEQAKRKILRGNLARLHGIDARGQGRGARRAGLTEGRPQIPGAGTSRPGPPRRYQGMIIRPLHPTAVHRRALARRPAGAERRRGALTGLRFAGASPGRGGGGATTTASARRPTSSTSTSPATGPASTSP